MESSKESTKFLDIKNLENTDGSNKELTPAQNRIRWRNLAVVMIILNVLLLIIVLTVVIVWQNDRNEKQVVPHPETMCLPCKDLSLHKDDDIWNFVEFTVTTDDKGQDICCADTQEELQNLVKLVNKGHVRTSVHINFCSTLFSMHTILKQKSCKFGYMPCSTS